MTTEEREPDIAAGMAEEEPGVVQRRVAQELRSGLARHLYDGRPVADVALVLLAVLAVFAFWSTRPAWLHLSWLAALIATTGARALTRARVDPWVRDARDVIKLVRWDVWSGAFLWGVWALIHVGIDAKDLAFLFAFYSGLVAAATSTLVADRPSFHGFIALIVGPVAVSVSLSGWSRDHAVLLALIVLYIPLMLVVHRRAHERLIEQFQTSARLRISEETATRRRDFLNALVTSAPTPIVVLDSAGRVLRANPAFERVLGRASSEVIGRDFLSAVAGSEEAPAVERFLQVVRGGQGAVADLHLTRADGTPIWMRLSATLVHGLEGGVLILVGEDVTLQVATREAQERARVHAEEAVRAKSSFLASMSHEIRTPLNGVLGMTEILLDTTLTADQRQAAEIIRSSGEGLLRVLNDILDVSKIEAGQMSLETVDFDLPALLQEIARVYSVSAARRDNELSLDLDPTLPRALRGDAHRLRQVLSNLLGNAVKFTERGDVVLAVRRTKATATGHLLSFSVRDTGIGIDPSKHEQVFLAFEQADSSTTRTYGGTGLGLSISRRLVELMGGLIELESAPGKGSDFSFSLDLASGTGPRQDERGQVRSASIEGRRFLVVDDNATARRIVREGLSHSGAAAVVEAESVERGIAELKVAAEASSPFQAVILDHVMPERDGFDFAEAVRADPSLGSPPLLMLTSAGMGGGAESARAVGIGGYLAKPVSRLELVRALESLLAYPGLDGAERSIITRETPGRVGGGIRILLAEDNQVNQKVAIGLLRKRGHHVFPVTDGRQAVEAVKAQTFDLVLMDVQMPGMDGLEATRQIRRLGGFDDLPIVALTAHALSEERDRCHQAGMNDFLAKPFKPDDLFETVSRWTSSVVTPTTRLTGGNEPTYRPTYKPPVDVEGFREAMRDGGVEEIVGPTLEMFVSEAPGIFAGLSEAVSSKKAEEIRRAAHSLKSASGNIRAHRLVELLETLEQLGRDADLAGAEALFAEVEEEHTAVMTFLRTGPRA